MKATVVIFIIFIILFFCILGAISDILEYFVKNVLPVIIAIIGVLILVVLFSSN